ncbi:MAG: HAMP domain-containing protein [Nitrospirae bacterium]|nr:HAMP domain-containing protein [Nitrospirota bacterium]
MKQRGGIRAKVFTALGVLWIITLASLLASLKYFESIYERVLVEKANIVGLNLRSDINEMLSLGLSIGELEGLQKDVGDLVFKGLGHGKGTTVLRTNLAYVFITDPTAKVLYHSHVSEIGKTFTDPFTLRTISARESLTGHSMFQGHEVLDISIPIVSDQVGEGILGVVRLGIPEDEINKQTRPLWMITIALLATVGLAAFFLMWFLSRSLIMPLTHLIRNVLNVAEGDLSEEITIQTRDELGHLSTSFNSMVQRLNFMFQQIKGAAKKVYDASDTITNYSRQVNEGSQLQKESVVETSTHIDFMKKSVTDVVDKVNSLSDSLTRTSSVLLEMQAGVEEIGDSADHLLGYVEETSSSVVQMSAATKQIYESSSQLSRMAEDTASSMQEMAVSIREVQQQATETSEMADQMAERANLGREQVQSSIRGIKQIETASQEASHVMVTLRERTEEIGKVVKVISDVAERTNLLALNAAIISAQAGEYGREFRVVADEIKALADLTSQKTKEISGIITTVQDESERAKNSVGAIVSYVNEGVRRAQMSGEALERLLESIKKTRERMMFIVNATKEQSLSSRKVNEAANETYSMTQAIVTSTKEHVATGEHIKKATEEMREKMMQVRESIQGHIKSAGLIMETFSAVKTLFDEITRAVREQVTGGERITREISKIQAISARHGETVDKLQNLVNVLMEQARLLEEGVGRFKTR